MGLEASRDLMAMNFDIPPSLRPIHPFLYVINHLNHGLETLSINCKNLKAQISKKHCKKILKFKKAHFRVKLTN